MKKVICVFIALVVFISSLCPLAFAYNHVSYADRTPASEAFDYLKMMQLADDIIPGTHITRGQAVTSIIKTMGLYDAAVSADISYYTNEQKAAYFAYRIGILSSSDPSGWNLSDNVTLAQTAKMLVVALGYNARINPVNAYPTAYLTQASNLGLLKYVSVSQSEQGLTSDEFATMLCQAMNTSVLEMAGIQGDNISYVSHKDTTLEKLYLDAKGYVSGEGIITQDSFGSLYPNSEYTKDSISVDGKSYKNTDSMFNGYVGYKVKYVATDASERNSRFIGMMISSDNNAVTLTSDDEPFLKDNCVYYYDNSDKEQKLPLSVSAVFMINGTLSESFTLANIDFENGDYEFIDNNSDKKYDVVKCDYSESFIVNFVKDDIVYLKNGLINSKSVIDLSDTDTVSCHIRDTNGNPLSVSDILADDGITVVASADFSYIEIIKLDPPKDIKLTEASDDKVKADGIWYTVGNVSLELLPGQTYTVRINEKNEIFHATQEYHGCVYVMDKDINTTGINNSVMLKIYDIETGIRVLTASNKVNINGTSYTDNSLIYTSIPKGTLINLDTNSKGEFTKISELNKYGEQAIRIYCKYVSAFNDTVKAESVPFRFDEKTIFFTVPENGNDNDYGVDVDLKDNYEYTTQGYELNEETGAVKAAVIIVQTDMKTNLTYKADVAVIESVSQVALSDGEATYKIAGFDDGKKFLYHAGQYDDVFRVCSTLASGDVVRYIVNYADEIVAIERIAELSKANTGYNNGKNTADEQIFGQALSLDKNVITNNSKYLYHRLAMSTNLSFNNLSSMEFFAHVENTADPESQFADYYVYDKKTKKLSLASVDDIITYEMAGDGASWIFVQKSYTDVKCIVIVK